MPLDGEDETVSCYLVKDEAHGFSLYIEDGIYEAVQQEDGLLIREKGAEDGASMALRVLPGQDAKALADAAYAAYHGSEDTLWRESLQDPVPGYFMVGDDEAVKGHTLSRYWFEMEGGALEASYSLSSEGQEGHGVRMCDMLETLAFAG